MDHRVRHNPAALKRAALVALYSSERTFEEIVQSPQVIAAVKIVYGEQTPKKMKQAESVIFNMLSNAQDIRIIREGDRYKLNEFVHQGTPDTIPSVNANSIISFKAGNTEFCMGYRVAKEFVYVYMDRLYTSLNKPLIKRISTDAKLHSALRQNHARGCKVFCFDVNVVRELPLGKTLETDVDVVMATLTF